MTADERRVRAPQLARVEGEGGMDVLVRDGHVAEVRLNIYEPPRFFEALLRGRRFTEPPDITARICGICPVAYQMSSVQAMEDACMVEITEPIRALRRLLYCGEWIESHALHITMLHAPDFLGYESVIEMAAGHRGAVERGLRVKKAGNEIISVVGGRSVHPVNVRVGGFWRALARTELAPLRESLLRARDDALEMVAWVAEFDFPEYQMDYEFVSLRHPSEYPMNEGRIVSSRGLDVAAHDYDDHFDESQVAHSTALHSSLRARGAYLVGPLARYALNADLLSPVAKDAARAAGVPPIERNPFRSIVVRAVETLYACDEAIRIIDKYVPPEPPAVEVVARAATGFGATEAPRGILYHRYQIDADGVIVDAKIVPPTSQNQAQIERDLAAFVEANLALDEDRLTWECEQMIRNYDPCISCATHFLRLRIER